MSGLWCSIMFLYFFSNIRSKEFVYNSFNPIKMEIVNVESFSKLLQLSVSPVVLISAVGLVLLSVTNRLGRSIDRSRVIANELDNENIDVAREGKEQLRVLVRRAEFLRVSVSLSVASIFFSCLMILFLFIQIFFEIHLEYAVLSGFCLNLLSLMGSVLYLLADISLALRALKIEVARHLN